jgi:hypothetical protein
MLYNNALQSIAFNSYYTYQVKLKRNHIRSQMPQQEIINSNLKGGGEIEFRAISLNQPSGLGLVVEEVGDYECGAGGGQDGVSDCTALV